MTIDQSLLTRVAVAEPRAEVSLLDDLLAALQQTDASLDAANLALTADQATIAQVRATDAATIAGLNSQIAIQTATILDLQQQLAAALQNPPPPPPPPPPVNHPPQWQVIPPIIFTQGKAGRISIAQYVTDPDGDQLTITKNLAPLPAGVTYDSAAKEFVYDGVGQTASLGGQVLTADDGKA